MSAVSIDKDKVIAYVKWQQRQDSGQANLNCFKSAGTPLCKGWDESAFLCFTDQKKPDIR